VLASSHLSLRKNWLSKTRSISNVPIAYPSHRSHSYPGWRPAHLGSQPQLGVWTEWWYRSGGCDSGGAIVDGTHLKAAAYCFRKMPAVDINRRHFFACAV
jgi:hypothetical protein